MKGFSDSANLVLSYLQFLKSMPQKLRASNRPDKSYERTGALTLGDDCGQISICKYWCHITQIGLFNVGIVLDNAQTIHPDELFIQKSHKRH